jgi:multiple antibiotic resistance protein
VDGLVPKILAIVGGYFAIMNPIANTAIFTSMTAGLPADRVRGIARTSVLTAFFIVLAFVVLGKLIFDFFGISLPALRLAGGVMIFRIGYGMMHGEQSEAHSAVEGESVGSDSIGISPLGIPILAGPGTIAVAMNYSATGDIRSVLANGCVFAFMCIVTYVCFDFGQAIEKKLGANGIKVATQLMGLILAVIGAQMLLDGWFGAVAQYASTSR